MKHPARLATFVILLLTLAGSLAANAPLPIGQPRANLWATRVVGQPGAPSLDQFWAAMARAR